MGAEPQPAQGQPIRYLVVTASGRRLAIPARGVKRILRELVVLPVPGAASELLGLGQYGGEPLAVLDLGLLVAMGDGDRADDAVGSGPRMTIVAGIGDPAQPETVGLAVHDAHEVVEIAETDLHRSEVGAAAGEALVGEDLVLVLDLSRLGGDG